MKKVNLEKKYIYNIVILGVLYLSWIISTFIIRKVNGFEDPKNFFYNYYGMTVVLGSLLALIYTILLHYPLLSIMSKNVNSRVENEVVALRRDYSIKCLYTIIVGFYLMSICVIAKSENIASVTALGFGLLELFAGLTMFLYSAFTIEYSIKYRNLLFVDKKQHQNADVESK